MIKKLLSLVLVFGICFATLSCQLVNPSTQSKEPKKEIKNVIVLIGDGMGPNQIKAGEIYKEEQLFMQTIEQTSKVETVSVYGDTTDSAAAATALATGIRTINGQVGIDVEGNEQKTLVDFASELGKRTAVISTEQLYGATPMGFSAHAPQRGQSEILMESAATTSNVNLFASFTISTEFTNKFVENGYELVENPDDISESELEKIIGSYNILAGAESMTLDSRCLAFDGLVKEALDYLSKDEDGFFLMAEGAHIDHGGHNNNISYMLEELLAFDDMVKYVVNWASKRNDTLVIVTADHETGGLSLNGDVPYGQLFELGTNGRPNYNWTTTGHTSTYVNIYAYGAEIDFKAYSSFEKADLIKNVDVFKIAKAYLTGEEI